jgi:amino acid adenylation domain-containing protein
MVGLFINTLPVRVQVSEEAELWSWLKQLQAQQVEREQYSYSPLVEIHRMSDVPQGMPLFESIVVFENYPVDASLRERNHSLDIGNVRVFERTNYPLTVVAVPGSELSLEIGYDTSRFEVATIGRMLGHLQSLIEGIVANPQQRVAELPLLPEAERHQLLVEWNDTQTEYPQSDCIHQLFEAQVERTPEAIAVVFDMQQLTYRELNARANQLAHHLQAMGVGPEVLVGICVERSLEMVVGLLGIIKAGGAYVPLDPAYPQERLAFMLNDSQVPVLLTVQKLVPGLPDFGARLVCLDTDWGVISQESEENSVSGAIANNLAYVIYTSGSTGKPKGVLVTHQNLLQSTNARISYYREPLTSFLLLSSFAFDSSVAGIFWTFCQGGILLLPQQNFQQDPVQLTKLIAQNHVSHLLSLASLYALILAHAEPQQLLQLRTVIVAGEPCPGRLIELHSERLGHTSLFNEYGPTEATVWSSVYKCRFQEKITQVPIGRPIANTQMYILDRHLQPVPIGVPGQLYIGGDGLTRGYLNRPDLTEEKFIPNPFEKSKLKTQNSKSNRLYKTGDLARYLPDGNIEFLGRIDNQVKIRGFRIELGEIEAVLAQYPEVGETVVIAREDQPGNKRLVAYVVPKQEQPTTSELRSFLKEQLPDYMVPSAFVMLEALPLTPNGKVDRRALPAPDTTRSSLEAGFVPPRTPTEEVLAAIWADVLGIEVGIQDDFFELGGHSLLATQIISRLREAFQVELPLRAIFERHTVTKLAELVVAKQCEQAQSDALAQILFEVDELSDDEVTQQLVAADQ